MNRQKGIVFKNTSSYSIFLTDDGRFLKGIPDSRAVNVGDEVSFRPYVELISVKQNGRTAYMAPLIAAVAILFMFFSVLLPSQAKVSAYVQVDFNPSIELGIDNQGDVQTFRGLNEDGNALKREISFWKGKSLTWVLTKIVDESNFTFEEDNHFGVTTIISEEKNHVALEKIITTAVTKTTVKMAPETIQINQATTEERLQANEKGVSVGTYKDSQEKGNLKVKPKEKPAISKPKNSESKKKTTPPISGEGKQKEKNNQDQHFNNGKNQKKINQQEPKINRDNEKNTKQKIKDKKPNTSGLKSNNESSKIDLNSEKQNKRVMKSDKHSQQKPQRQYNSSNNKQDNNKNSSNRSKNNLKDLKQKK